MYWRNKEDLLSIEGIEVEAGSLWKRVQEKPFLVLVDNDQYVSSHLDEELFEPA